MVGRTGWPLPVLLLAVACTHSTETVPVVSDTSGETGGYDPREVPTFTDMALVSGLQDPERLRRGRGCIAADFDNDGWIDLFMANPGDPSGVFRNLSSPGQLRFEPSSVLFDDLNIWGGSAADYDNDGDIDLFLTVGGNEGRGTDHLMRNQFVETGFMTFEEVSAEAGVSGIPFGDDRYFPNSSGSATWVDIDRDGWLDLWVNGNLYPYNLPTDYGTFMGRNTVFRNNQDGTFSDRTQVVGLALTQRHTRHSSWLDIDNDGDLDLYENNYGDTNVLWRNDGKTEGFTDVTRDYSIGAEDLRMSLGSFASATADFNQDGWEDILVFTRQSSRQDRYDGHVLFINLGGLGVDGFYNVADHVGLNHEWIDDVTTGVMGASVHDVNMDGYPDIWVGNGGPPQGERNSLMVSDVLVDVEVPNVGTLKVPFYGLWSHHIDFGVVDPLRHEGHGWPEYPYRTHGTCIADYDRDGSPELMVINGGPAASPDSVQEPNRLWDMKWEVPRRWLSVRVVGDGWRVPFDGAHTLVRLTLLDEDGQEVVRHQRIHTTNGFSAQHGLEAFFGLGNAQELRKIELVWTDGLVDTLEGPIDLDQHLVIQRGGGLL